MQFTTSALSQLCLLEMKSDKEYNADKTARYYVDDSCFVT